MGFFIRNHRRQGSNRQPPQPTGYADYNQVYYGQAVSAPAQGQSFDDDIPF
ncbi:hypothetical protein [Lonepinella koalarum]|uniref:hypothetical protein n=1 Tax=Lonepinella koalarum TaxID=53417 RepID=UPI003F6DC55D